MTHTRILVGLVGAIVVAPALQAQVIVVNQPTDNPNGLYADGVDGQFADTRTADNFAITDAQHRRVTRVTWWGSSDLDYVDPHTFPAWVIRFQRDASGLPGETIQVETILAQDVTFSPTGAFNMYDAPEYEQSVTLDNPPEFWHGTPYWISIGAVVADPTWEAWLWSLNYGDGDGLCAQNHAQQGYQVVHHDLAFCLFAEAASDQCPRPGAAGKFCSGDIAGQGDCIVNLDDLAELLGAYGRCPGDALYNPAADIAPDGNPCIDLSDLAELLGQYGNDCR